MNIAKFDIIHQIISPYIPQKIRVVRRKNRTLKDMVNAILISFGLS